VFYALVIAGVFRTLFFQPFWIPSESMKDTLLIGDFLFVNKMAYGYSRYSCPFSLCPISGRLFGSDPERGDVVVFRHPGQGRRFHQARDRPARRHRADEGRRAVPERPAGAAGTRRHLRGTDGAAGPDAAAPALRERPGGRWRHLHKAARSVETLPNGVTHMTC
jgi:signal peptidase I